MFSSKKFNAISCFPKWTNKNSRQGKSASPISFFIIKLTPLISISILPSGFTNLYNTLHSSGLSAKGLLSKNSFSLS